MAAVSGTRRHPLGRPLTAGRLPRPRTSGRCPRTAGRCCGAARRASSWGPGTDVRVAGAVSHSVRACGGVLRVRAGVGRARGRPFRCRASSRAAAASSDTARRVPAAQRGPVRWSWAAVTARTRAASHRVQAWGPPSSGRAARAGATTGHAPRAAATRAGRPCSPRSGPAKDPLDRRGVRPEVPCPGPPRPTVPAARAPGRRPPGRCRTWPPPPGPPLPAATPTAAPGATGPRPRRTSPRTVRQKRKNEPFHPLVRWFVYEYRDTARADHGDTDPLPDRQTGRDRGD